MTLSTSKVAFDDCYALMDAALFDPKGIRCQFATLGKARYFRMRCHRARELDRAGNAKTYEPEHLLHGRSQYDRLFFRLRDEDGQSLEFEKSAADTPAWLHIDCEMVLPLRVESLSGAQVVLKLPAPQMKALTAPPPAPREAPSDDELADAFEDMPVVEEPKKGLRRV